MNDTAKQKPQVSPQRLHTQRNPQIQGSLAERWRWVSCQQTRDNPQIQDYTNELFFIKGLFIVRFTGRIQRQEFWVLQVLLGLLTLPIGWLLNRLSGGVVGAIGLLLLLRVLTGGGLGRLGILSRSLEATLLWCCLLKCGWLVEIIALLFGGGKLGVLSMLLVLACLYFMLVSLGMQVRRLHDIGMSGWTILLGLTPILGDIVLFVMYCRNSQYGVNQWGPNPKGQGNEQAVDAVAKYRLTAEQEAAKKYRLAAGQGDADAQNNLGKCYYYGNGVDKNYAEAVKWYRVAAEQELAEAQNNLGVCYYYGRGVDRNYAEAVKWYRIAAGQGFTDAQYNLGVCYANGDGVSKNPTEAAKWYRRAADSGDRDAMYELGKCYLKGMGVAKDRQRAKRWFWKAADHGSTDAKELLQELEQR